MKQNIRRGLLIQQVTTPGAEVTPDSLKFRLAMIDACMPWWGYAVLFCLGALALYGAVKLP